MDSYLKRIYGDLLLDAASLLPASPPKNGKSYFVRTVVTNGAELQSTLDVEIKFDETPPVRLCFLKCF